MWKLLKKDNTDKVDLYILKVRTLSMWQEQNLWRQRYIQVPSRYRDVLSLQSLDSQVMILLYIGLLSDSLSHHMNKLEENTLNEGKHSHRQVRTLDSLRSYM